MKKTVLFKNSLFRATAALFISFGLCSGAYAEYNVQGIPDSAEIRKTLVDSWFTAPVSEIQAKSSEIIRDAAGNDFQIRCEETENEYIIVVAPKSVAQIKYVDRQGTETRKVAVFNQSAMGSWVLYRNKSDGKASAIRWYFSADPDVYFIIRPSSVKTYVDLSVFGHLCTSFTPIGVSFKKMYSMSFQEFQTITRKTIPWEKVSVTTGIYNASYQMISVIRNNLKRMYYMEDAAYNEKGKLYSIIKNEPYTVDGVVLDACDSDGTLSFNGAGFIKWIIDGIVEPFTLKRTNLGNMCTSTIEFNPLGKNGVLEQAYNLSFSIDWCRNLACEAQNARSSIISSWKNAGIDVDVNNFVDIAGYIPDTGYSIENLKSILYVQGITEPGYFYLAAIKQHSVIKPEEFVFNDCAVIFPYFDDAGRFACVIFEKGEEISFEEFLSRHADSFVHLNRVKAAEEFYPR